MRACVRACERASGRALPSDRDNGSRSRVGRGSVLSVGAGFLWRTPQASRVDGGNLFWREEEGVKGRLVGAIMRILTSPDP